MKHIAREDVPSMGNLAEAIMYAAKVAPGMHTNGRKSRAKKLLTLDEQRCVRRLFATNNWTVAALSREYSVSQRQIRNCVT
jgi:hypothetical protein